MNLLNDTYGLLDQARKNHSLRQIAEGSGVNYHWLAKFAQRAYPDPSVVKVQTLYSWLAERSCDQAA
jgi:hypothetical protein